MVEYSLIALSCYMLQIRSLERETEIGTCTFERVAIYIREGAKRTREGAATLKQLIRTEMLQGIGAYETVHFCDQVGRSFSRIRVYTERPR